MDSKTVLDIFKEITGIPRESGHEEHITAWLCKFAEDHHLEYKKDSTGNVVIIREASPGKENVPTIVLQSHQDMVCEKIAGSGHDFAKDPVKYEIEDGWMIARETTLGADDGIGIAAELALLASPLKTGRLECVFTISEETGMDGAFAMEKGFFTGKTLINLDSEDEGQLFIGCAGGVDSTATFHWQNDDFKPLYSPVKLNICNALGGHSGDDINKGRLNAVQTMARFLYSELKYDIQLIILSGGNKPNAIARECEAVIAVAQPDETIGRFLKFADDIKKEFSVTDPDIEFSASRFRCTEKPVQGEVARRLITALNSCPHGVLAMSQDIPGLVETSTNLAAVRMTERGTATVVTSQRSSINSACEAAADKVEGVFRLAGAEVERHGEYPGWKPNVNSTLLERCVASYRKLFNTEPEVKAIHAGLECGLFEEKFGGLDMISFGPTLRGVHAPGERLELASLDKFVSLLVDVVVNYE